MLARFKKERKPNQRSALRTADIMLKSASAVLIDALADNIAIIDTQLDKAKSATAQKYSTEALARVLIAADNYHLKLKLDKPAADSPRIPLIKYLNPTETYPQSFASVCKGIANDLKCDEDTMTSVNLTRLRNVFVYLLSLL